jgi:predicted DNA-binding transcriptional regulator YafY
MARNEFALGVALGGLAGLALGYLIRRNGMDSDEQLTAPETIDLTPALRRRNASAVVGEAVQASD